MEWQKSKKYLLTIDNNGKSFFYNGFIISESEDGFLTFQDERIGKVLFNKQKIIKIEECEQQ